MRDRAEHLRRKDEEEAAPVVDGPERTGPVARLQDMQRGMGNAAVVELLGVQPKMQVGGVNDPAEAEADRVAAQVLRHLDGGGPAAAEPAQQRGGLARMVRRKAAPGGASTSPGHGPAGGDVLPETAGAIDAARGGGKPMDDATLTRMEGAFGTDLSDVRIHTDGASASLNRDLNARAFTTGKDVFFGAGEYDPGSRSGQEVLAHELTHTIQQGGSDAQRISRLTVNDTNWDAVQTAKISSGGAAGVAIVSDGAQPIVVKSGEPMGPELVIAANLFNEQSEDTDEYKVGTPQVRIASQTESDQIKAKLEATIDTSTMEDDQRFRVEDFLNRLDGPTTVIFSFAGGKDFKDVIAEQKATKKKGIFSSKREMRGPSTMNDLLSQPGQLRALGRIAAADIFMGNGDRVTRLTNLENWKIDPGSKTINVIDNADTYAGGQFVTYGNMSGQMSFNDWHLKTPLTAQLCAKDYAGLGALVVRNLAKYIPTVLRDEDKALITKMFTDNQGLLEQWTAEGFQEGVKRLLASMTDPWKLVNGISPDDVKREALTSIYARRFALEGSNDPWATAEIMAEERFTNSPFNLQAPKKTRKRR